MTGMNHGQTNGNSTPNGWMIFIIGSILVPFVIHCDSKQQSESQRNEDAKRQNERDLDEVMRFEEQEQRKRRDEELARVPDLKVTNYRQDGGLTFVEVANLSKSAAAEITQTRIVVEYPPLLEAIRNARMRPSMDLYDHGGEFIVCMSHGRWEEGNRSFSLVRNKTIRIPAGGMVELRVCNHEPITDRMRLHGKIVFVTNQEREFGFDGMVIGP